MNVFLFSIWVPAQTGGRWRYRAGGSRSLKSFRPCLHECQRCSQRQQITRRRCIHEHQRQDHPTREQLHHRILQSVCGGGLISFASHNSPPTALSLGLLRRQSWQVGFAVNGLFIGHHSAGRGARAWCPSDGGRHVCACYHCLARVIGFINSAIGTPPWPIHSAARILTAVAARFCR
jgi:hypothetical protein